MTTKTSPSNRRTGFLYRHAAGRLKGVGLISCIVYFAVFTIPFIIRSVQGQNIYSGDAGNIYGLSGSLLFILPVLMPLFTGVMSLQFMHQSDRADLYYSLPVKRHTLFFTHFLAGLTATILPLLVIYVPAAVTVMITNPFSISLLSLLIEFLTLSVTLLISYTLVCFVGVFTPTVLDHVLYTAGIGAAISLGMGYTTQALSTMLVGFPTGWMELGGFGALWCNPFLLSFRIFIADDRYRWPLILCFLAVAAVCLVLAAVGFSRGGCERAGRVGGRTLVKEICKYVGAYIGGLLMSLALGGMTSYAPAVMVIGLLLGSFIAYTIIEAVAMRSFRTFARSMKGYAIAAVCLLGLFSIVRFDLLGYQYRIPSADQVASVSIDYFGTAQSHIDRRDSEKNLSPVVLESPEAIEAVRSLHKGLAQRLVPQKIEQHAFTENLDIWMPVTVTYRLKNGFTVQRRYEKVCIEDFPLFAELCVVPEFRQKTDLSAMIEPSRYNTFALYSAVGEKAGTLELSLDEQKTLLDAIAKDRASESARQFARSDTPARGCLVITSSAAALSEQAKTLRKNGFNTYDAVVVIGAHYQNTLAFLESHGLLDEMRVEPSKVREAYVGYAGSTAAWQLSPLFLSEPNENYRIPVGALSEEMKVWTSFRAQGELEELLSCARLQYAGDRGYAVYFVTEGSAESQMLFIPYELAPDFLKNALNEYEYDPLSSTYGVPADPGGAPITAETIR